MQTTLDRNKGYNDGIECCADDCAVVLARPTLREELEQKLGHGTKQPLIVEEDVGPCPSSCEVIQGILDPDDECQHCSLISLTMGEAPQYLRK